LHPLCSASTLAQKRLLAAKLFRKKSALWRLKHIVGARKKRPLWGRFLYYFRLVFQPMAMRQINNGPNNIIVNTAKYNMTSIVILLSLENLLGEGKRYVQVLRRQTYTLSF
jgi:hypothetical protein